MKKIFYLLILIPSLSFTQDNKKYCNYITDNSEGSKGIKMKIFYLCSWEVHNGERQGVVKIFSNSTATENMTLIINAVPKEYILEKNQIKEDYKEMGKVISIRETKIENIKTIEAIIESTQERAVGKFKIKALLYSFIYKNCLVGISFSCQGFDRSVVNKKFLNEEGLFKLLVSRTILLDKLE